MSYTSNNISLIRANTDTSSFDDGDTTVNACYFEFNGYQDGRPKYLDHNYNYEIRFFGMDAKWYIYNNLGSAIYYSMIINACPDGMGSQLRYQLVVDNSWEGYIAGIY